MKKLFAIFLAVGLLSVFVAGCSGGDAGAEKPADKAPETKTEGTE